MSTQVDPISIYDIRTKRQRNQILAAAAVTAVLTPFTDTIYLPALASVQRTLDGATMDTVAASVSVYMAFIGLGTLVWGPLSDRFGRRWPLLVSIVTFLAFTIGCVFANNVSALVILRALQGAAVSASVSVTQGIIADAFPPEERGSAMGTFLQPLLVGPIVAPIVGGALSAGFGWRATFMLLCVLGLLILLVALTLPETLHYIVAKAWASSASGEKGHQDDQVQRQPIAGAELIPTPVMVAPWAPVAIMFEGPIRPYAAISCCNFASMFVALTTFPTVLAGQPYGLSEAIIGLCYIPIGVAMFSCSTLGGRLSDAAGHKRPGQPTARLGPSVLGSLFLPAGLLLYGLSFSYGLPLGVGLLGHFIIGCGQSLYGPGYLAYLSSVKQAQAAAAAAANMTLCFVLSGVLISAAVPLQQALTLGGLFILMACINVVMATWGLLDLRARTRTEQARLDKLAGPDSSDSTFSSSGAVGRDDGGDTPQPVETPAHIHIRVPGEAASLVTGVASSSEGQDTASPTPTSARPLVDHHDQATGQARGLGHEDGMQVRHRDT